MWTYRGQKRPPFAAIPSPGQESVWDYPRPPAVELCSRLVEVKAGDLLLARSTQTLRVLETASPPGYYIPPTDVIFEHLARTADRSACEWKGLASYWRLASHPRGNPLGWSYDDPTPNYVAIAGYLTFYPGRVECTVDGERVRPQPGFFYGGWITKEIAGPVKGAPGTGQW